MARLAALMLVKGESKRLPGKNLKDFNGKPMFMWNLEKCLKLFHNVYVSSDSLQILKLASNAGAIPIYRPKSLCGDVPDIPVYQHALAYMKDTDAIVAVHANNPNLDPEKIKLVQAAMHAGAFEVMTCYPVKAAKKYKNQAAKINGSIRGIQVHKLMVYPDPYNPRPDVMVTDDSIEIETIEDYNKALKQCP